MKKIMFLFLLCSSLGFSQELPKLAITKTSLEPIVVNVEGKTAKELYTSALNFVQEFYKNPDEVLKATVENDMIRFEGYKEDAWFYRVLGITHYYDMSYTVIVKFKDGKYKYEVNINKFFVPEGGAAYFLYDSFYKKNGNPRKVYLPAIESLNTTLNMLHLDFYSYLTSSKKTDDW